MAPPSAETMMDLDMCCEAFEDFFEEAAAHVRGLDGEGGREHPTSAEAAFCSHPRRGRDWAADFDVSSFDPNACARDSCVVASRRDDRMAYRMSGDLRSRTLAANWRAAEVLTRKYALGHTVLGRPTRLDAAALAA